MSQPWYGSDLHEGHKNIGKFRKIPQEFLDMAEGDAIMANHLWLWSWASAHINKRDTMYILGDAAFTEKGIDRIATYPGTKYLFGGNHDDLPATSYLRAFKEVRGCKKMKQGFWVSHFPIHTDELRSKFCVHGHTHYHVIDDWRYINVCCDHLQETIGQPFINLRSLVKTMEHRRKNGGTEILL